MPIESAKTLQNGSAQSGGIAFRGEEGLFQLDVPNGHEVFVSASGETYPVVDIVNASGEILIRGQSYKTSRYVKGEETIYAKFYGYGGNQGAYSITFDSELYLTEEQKLLSAPNLSPAESTKSGEISQQEEVDYYKIEANADDLIKIQIRSDHGLFPTSKIFDQDGNTLIGPSAYGSDHSNFGLYEVPATIESLFLSVESYLGQYNGAYSVEAKFTTRSKLKDEVLELVNIERSKERLSPMTYDPLLEYAAQLHVEDMEDVGRYLAHTGSNGSSPGSRIQATGYRASWHDSGGGYKEYISSENAAYGQTSAAEVMDAWMHSPGHRAAIMDPIAEQIGIGFGLDVNTGSPYWIQNFGIPWVSGDEEYTWS